MGTRTSPPGPGAVGAVGHPFGQSRLVDRNALRALLSASAPRMYSPFGASSHLPPSPRVSPSIHQNRCPVTRADHFFETKSVENKSKKYFPNSPTGSHYVSAVKSIHYGGARTSNLPLNSLANMNIGYRHDFLHHNYVALNESAPTAR